MGREVLLEYDLFRARIAGVNYAAWWSGTALSFVNLHTFLPPGYNGSRAQAVWENGGVAYVAGFATNATTQRAEAVLWSRVLTPQCDAIDFNHDGLFPDIQDIADFLTVFAGGVCDGQAPADPPCNSDIDFNNDALFPDTQDIQSLLSVFSGGACL